MAADALDISTHTLTWSVTEKSERYQSAYANFNSHAHVERDLFSFVKIALVNISTHTLTWSVTRVTDFDFHAVTRFQLTRSRGA